MLVLSRKVDEVIVVDNVISVRVLKIQGTKVHLGIVAPAHVPIHRQELSARNLSATTTIGISPPERSISAIA